MCPVSFPHPLSKHKGKSLQCKTSSHLTLYIIPILDCCELKWGNTGNPLAQCLAHKCSDNNSQSKNAALPMVSLSHNEITTWFCPLFLGQGVKFSFTAHLRQTAQVPSPPFRRASGSRCIAFQLQTPLRSGCSSFPPQSSASRQVGLPLLLTLSIRSPSTPPPQPLCAFTSLHCSVHPDFPVSHCGLQLP